MGTTETPADQATPKILEDFAIDPEEEWGSPINREDAHAAERRISITQETKQRLCHRLDPLNPWGDSVHEELVG